MDCPHTPFSQSPGHELWPRFVKVIFTVTPTDLLQCPSSIHYKNMSFFCSSNLAWKMIRSLLSDPSDRPDVKTQTFRPPVETNISRFENPLLCLSNGRILRKELQPLICKVSGSPGKAHQKSTIKSGPSFFWWKQNVQMTVSL